MFRLQMLVVFKSAPILKRALKVKNAMMQLYILKLLKMQTKYLGRQWRKSNMKTMSAIYQKVRHRLTDDWAYGNGECVICLRRFVIVIRNGSNLGMKQIIHLCLFLYDFLTCTSWSPGAKVLIS